MEDAMKGRSVALAVLLAMMGSGAASASVGEDECESLLLAAPLEDAVLPEGYEWGYLTLDGVGWEGALWAVDPALEYPPMVTFEIQCFADPTGALARITEATTALRPDALVPIEAFGSGSIGLRDERDFITVWWTEGSVLGSVRPWGVRMEEFEAADLVSIAKALDAVMAGSGRG